MLEIIAFAAAAIGVYECATHQRHDRINRATKSAVAASDKLAMVKICKRQRRKEA